MSLQELPLLHHDLCLPDTLGNSEQMLQVVRGCPQLRVLNGLLLDGIQRLNKFWQRLQVTFKVFNGVSDFLKYTTNLNTEQGILTHTYVLLAGTSNFKFEEKSDGKIVCGSDQLFSI